jgi:hypothetical protein
VVRAKTGGRKAPRPSGPTQTKAQRRASGKTRLDVWIHDESAEFLEAAALKWGTTKAALLEDAIRLLSETAVGFGIGDKGQGNG